MCERHLIGSYRTAFGRFVFYCRICLQPKHHHSICVIDANMLESRSPPCTEPLAPTRISLSLSVYHISLILDIHKTVMQSLSHSVIQFFDALFSILCKLHTLVKLVADIIFLSKLLWCFFYFLSLLLYNALFFVLVFDQVIFSEPATELVFHHQKPFVSWTCLICIRSAAAASVAFVLHISPAEDCNLCVWMCRCVPRGPKLICLSRRRFWIKANQSIKFICLCCALCCVYVQAAYLHLISICFLG